MSIPSLTVLTFLLCLSPSIFLVIDRADGSASWIDAAEPVGCWEDSRAGVFVESGATGADTDGVGGARPVRPGGSEVAGNLWTPSGPKNNGVLRVPAVKQKSW